MSGVRFGAKVDNYGPRVPEHGLAEPAQQAEEAGFDSLWLSDHVMMPKHTASRYPFSADGSITWDPRTAWYDAIVALGVLATATRRVEIGVGVLIMALRHPLILAKQIASVDALAGGRVVLGVGAGWLAEEFAALGIPFETRGRRLDECIEVLRRSWTGEPSPFDGQEVGVAPGVIMQPTPARHVPLVIGGMSAAALRRAARNDGWFPLPMADDDWVEVVEGGIKQMAAVRKQEGFAGHPPRVVLNAAAPEDVAPLLPRLAAVGVTDVIVDVDYDDADGPARALEVLRSGLGSRDDGR